MVNNSIILVDFTNKLRNDGLDIISALKEAGEARFRPIILTTGTWADRMLGVPGEDLEGVEGCISFLNRFYHDGIKELNENVAVVGDVHADFRESMPGGFEGQLIEFCG